MWFWQKFELGKKCGRAAENIIILVSRENFYLEIIHSEKRKKIASLPKKWPEAKSEEEKEGWLLQRGF